MKVEELIAKLEEQAILMENPLMKTAAAMLLAQQLQIEQLKLSLKSSSCEGPDLQ